MSPKRRPGRSRFAYLSVRGSGISDSSHSIPADGDGCEGRAWTLFCSPTVCVACSGAAPRKPRSPWPEGTRREQRVAVAPDDPRRLATLVAEPPYQRRLANSRLAAHKHDLPPPTAPHSLQTLAKRRKLISTLKQLGQRPGGDSTSNVWHHTSMMHRAGEALQPTRQEIGNPDRDESHKGLVRTCGQDARACGSRPASTGGLKAAPTHGHADHGCFVAGAAAALSLLLSRMVCVRPAVPRPRATAKPTPTLLPVLVAGKLATLRLRAGGGR